MGQKGTWDTPGGPTMPPHHMVARPGPGRAVAWCGVPWPSTYLSTLHFTLSPEISSLHSSNPCSCYSFSQFSISLLSPSLLLRFGASVLRYVTPSIVQVKFCLVEYFSTIGDRLNEFACLFYCLDMLF
jgi:hypothetical protein